MSFTQLFNELVQTKDISLQQILNNLLDGTSDLDLKTHINNPKDMSALYILTIYFKAMKLPKSAKLLDVFIEKFTRYMVSYKRLSRKEIITAISRLVEIQDDTTTIEKMNKNKTI